MLLLVAVLVVAASPMQAISQTPQARDPELAQKLSLAEAHHDLAELYIKKGDFDRAVAEARLIIQLRFPADYEGLVGQSLSIITERFAEAKRFDVGQMLLDEALKAAELNANRAKIYANKARLYRLAGDNDRAIESWKRALELEGRPIR